LLVAAQTVLRTECGGDPDVTAFGRAHRRVPEFSRDSTRCREQCNALPWSGARMHVGDKRHTKFMVR